MAKHQNHGVKMAGVNGKRGSGMAKAKREKA